MGHFRPDGRKLAFINDSLDENEKVDKKLAKLKPGQIALLENIRFYSQEEKNGDFLARRLASLADIFVDRGGAVRQRLLRVRRRRHRWYTWPLHRRRAAKNGDVGRASQ